MEPFLGMIMPVSFNFAPMGWALCDGQLVMISENQQLYSLLGTNFGGDGRVTFALPDLRGRSPRGVSVTHPGTSSGAEAVTLSVAELAPHSHMLNASQTQVAGRPSSPLGKAFAAGTAPAGTLYGEPANTVALGPNNIAASGGGRAHDNMQPYLVINYIIAMEGDFPPRN